MDAGLDVAGLLAAAGAAFACHRAARHDEQLRRTWYLLAVGCLVWFAGTLIDAGRDASPPSPRDLGAILFAIAAIAGPCSLIRRRRQYEREETLAGLLAGVATIAVGFEFLVRPVLDGASTTIERDARRVDLSLQIAGVGLVLPIALALAIGVAGVRYRVLIMLLAGGIAPAAATALAGGRTGGAEGELAGLPALGWLTGFLALTMAAWLARDARCEPVRPVVPEVGAYLRRVGQVTCVCALAVTAAAVDASLRPGTEWVVVAMAVACGLLIAVRMGTAGAIADRLVQRTRERDRLATVLDLSTTIAGTLEVDRLLPALAAAAAQAADRTRVEVTLLAPDGRVELRASHGLTPSEEAALAGESACLSPALPVWPIAPTVRTIDDPIFTPSTVRVYRSIGKQHILIAPLRADRRVIGTVELWSPDDERPFAAEEITAAAALGREGGLAIQNARLLTETRARADERAMLLRVTQAATSSLELRTVLAEIALASLGVAGAECCTILLWHPDDDEFEIGADQTIPEWPGVEEAGNRFARDYFGSDSIVMASGQATRFDLASTELPESELAHMREMGTESVLVVPLVNGDVSLGTFNLLSPASRCVRRQRGAAGHRDRGADRAGDPQRASAGGGQTAGAGTGHAAPGQPRRHLQSRTPIRARRDRPRDPRHHGGRVLRHHALGHDHRRTRDGSRGHRSRLAGGR